MKSNLMAHIHIFLYSTSAEAFLNRFKWVLYPYLIMMVWQFDWSIYSTLASDFYKPVGIFSYFQVPFPSELYLKGTQVFVTVGALAALIKPLQIYGAIATFVGSLLLDGWHNGFGFVNVQIHTIWFSALMILFMINKKEYSGLSFRCMELILVLAYIQSGFNKLWIGGAEWMLEGTTLQIALLRQGMPFGVWFAKFGELMPILSVAVVTLEVAFVFYFFIKPVRQYLLLSAVMFHLGTWLLLGIDFSHLWIFSASLLLFGRELLAKNILQTSFVGEKNKCLLNSKEVVIY